MKLAGPELVGWQKELYLLEESPGKESPYERLLGDATMGDDALFTREDAVEAAWAIVDRVLQDQPPGVSVRTSHMRAQGGRCAHCCRRPLAKSSGHPHAQMMPSQHAPKQSRIGLVCTTFVGMRACDTRPSGRRKKPAWKTNARRCGPKMRERRRLGLYGTVSRLFDASDMFETVGAQGRRVVTTVADLCWSSLPALSDVEPRT